MAGLIVHRTIQAALLLVIALSPFPFGSIHPLPQFVLLTAVLSLMALWWIRNFLERRTLRAAIFGRADAFTSRVLATALIACSVFLSVGLLQVTPLPSPLDRVLAPKTSAKRREVSKSFQTLSPAPVGEDHPASVWDVATPLDWRPTISVEAWGTLRTLLLLFTYAATFLLVLGHFRMRIEIMVLMSVVGLTCFALSVEGILQRVLTPRKIYGYWVSEYGGNPFGPFVNENHFGGYMAMGIPVVLALAVSFRYWRTPFASSAGRAFGRRIWLPSWTSVAAWVLAASVPVMLVALVMSKSRGGLIAFAVVLLVMAVWFGWRWRREAGAATRMVLLVLLTGAACGGWLVSLVKEPFVDGMQTSSQALADRTLLWGPFARIGWDFLPLGSGLGSFGSVSPIYSPHGDQFEGKMVRLYRHAENDYIEVLAETGPLGLAAMLTFVASVVFGSLRALWQVTSSRSRWLLLLGSLAGFLAAVIHSGGDFVLRMPACGLLAASLAALCMNLAVSITRDTDASSPMIFLGNPPPDEPSPGGAGRTSRRRSIQSVCAVLGTGLVLPGLFVLGYLGYRCRSTEELKAIGKRTARDKPAEALAPLTDAVDLAWRDSRPHVQIASLVAPMGKSIAMRKTMSDIAIRHYVTAAWFEPFNGDIRYRLGQALLRSALVPGRSADEVSLRVRLASRELQESLKAEPGRFDAKLALTLAQRLTGRNALSRKLLQELLRHYPSRWREILDSLHLDPSEMLALGHLIPPDLESHYRLAEFYRGRKLSLYAKQEYELVCREAGAAEPGLRARAAGGLRGIGRDEDALKFLNEWIGKDPAEPAYRITRAEILGNRKRHTEAITDLEVVLKRKPLDRQARRALAGYYVRRGRLQKAEIALREGVRLAPRDARRYLDLAAFYERRQDWEKAVSVLNALMKLYPFKPEYVIRLGDVYSNQGLYSRALEAYRKAVQLGARMDGRLRERMERARKSPGAWLRPSGDVGNGLRP